MFVKLHKIQPTYTVGGKLKKNIKPKWDKIQPTSRRRHLVPLTQFSKLLRDSIKWYPLLINYLILRYQIIYNINSFKRLNYKQIKLGTHCVHVAGHTKQQDISYIPMAISK